MRKSFAFLLTLAISSLMTCPALAATERPSVAHMVVSNPSGVMRTPGGAAVTGNSTVSGRSSSENVSGNKTGSGNSIQKQPVMRGTWLSYVDMQEMLKGMDQESFDTAFGKICDTIRENGGNTIFVHVRSHNDAIYPSAVYPWSTHMLQGADPGYDPLKDMVKIAHDSGLSIHAWINPYGYRNGMISEHPELSNLSNILAGVAEILAGYDVDGIHFDDYFPPLGASTLNAMVSQVHQVCAANGRLFGIAPQGNIQNNIAMGADVETWLSKRGYVDYIAPQIYWTDNYGAEGTQAMSSERLSAWRALNKAGIPMYVGMALYRAGNQMKDDSGWTKQDDNLKRQAEKAKSLGYRGYILYNTKSQMVPNDTQKKEISNLKSVAW